MYTWQKLQCAANQRYALYHHLHLPFLHFYRDFATFTSSEYYEHFLAGISTSCLYYSCVHIIKDKSRCTAKTSAPKLVIVPVGVVYRKYSIFFLVAGTLHCTRLCFALLLQTVSTHTHTHTHTIRQSKVKLACQRYKGLRVINLNWHLQLKMKACSSIILHAFYQRRYNQPLQITAKAAVFTTSVQ